MKIRTPHASGNFCCSHLACRGATTRNTAKERHTDQAAVGRIAKAALPEIGLPVIELSPADCDPDRIVGIHGYARLVYGVTDDVVASRIHVYLVAGEDAMRRDHPLRSISR